MHPSITLLWHYSNKEAWQTDSQIIEPHHLMLAILNILDFGIDQDKDLREFSLEENNAILKNIQESKEWLSVKDDTITTLRRKIRQQYPLDRKIKIERLLHRSTETKAIFSESVEVALLRGSTDVELVDILAAFKKRSGGKDFKELFSKTPESYPKPSYISQNKNEKLDEVSGQKLTKTINISHVSTPLINQIGRDLTLMASQGKLPPIVGRDDVIKMIVRVFFRVSKRNVILVGEAGVGKTAIVEGAAQYLISSKASKELQSLRIVQINIADLITSTKYRGEMEERIQRIIVEASSNPNLILFFDEIHLLIKSGAAGESGMDIANLLKPALARGDFRCIGATTVGDYERYLMDDSAFNRRFQIINIPEPNYEATLAICNAHASQVETLQGVLFAIGTIEEAIRLAALYIHDRREPDRSIDVLENAAAYIKVSSLGIIGKEETRKEKMITIETIHTIMEEQYGVNISMSNSELSEKIITALKNQLIGQEQTIERIAKTITSVSIMDRGLCPRTVLLLIGPPKSGKADAVKNLKEILFPKDPSAFLTLNMGDYHEQHELTKLTGAAPGYIGHERPSPLFHFVAAHPQGIILLNDMDKAHVDAQNYFAEIFEKGEARSVKGHTANFKEYYFFATCDLPTRETIALIDSDQIEDFGKQFASELYKRFTPEFLDCVDQFIIFKELTPENYSKYFDILLKDFIYSLKIPEPITISMDESSKLNIVLSFAQHGGGTQRFKNQFYRQIVNPINKIITIDPKINKITIAWVDNQVTFSKNKGSTYII